MSDPKKDSMDAAIDIIKYINTLSTATLLFTFTFLKDFVILENIVEIAWLIYVSWGLFGLSVFLGVYALGRAVYVIKDGTYSVSDSAFRLPALFQQIIFIFGIGFLVVFIFLSMIV